MRLQFRAEWNLWGRCRPLSVMLTIHRGLFQIGAGRGGARHRYLATGTRVKAINDFVNGWVRLSEPYAGGWTQIASLNPLGAPAIVASVDYPDGCLRIRSGPSTSFPKVGCAPLGSRLELTGIWSQSGWAQVAGPVPGWVTASQISSSIKPPGTQRPVVIHSGPTVTTPVIVSPPSVVTVPVYPEVPSPTCTPVMLTAASVYGGRIHHGHRFYGAPGGVHVNVGHGWGHGGWHGGMHSGGHHR